MPAAVFIECAGNPSACLSFRSPADYPSLVMMNNGFISKFSYFGR